MAPSFNPAAGFINATIGSVVSQSGRFRLPYHVQDGRSKKEAIAEWRRWIEPLSSDLFRSERYGPGLSDNVAPDSAIYDTIAEVTIPAQLDFARRKQGEGAEHEWR